MKITNSDLEQLLQLQALILSNQKLEKQAAELNKGGDLEAARQAILENSQQLSAARASHEEIMREIRRVETDLELVTKREVLDQERLTKTAVSRDVIGIQHELETLKKRRSDLEDVELELLERREQSNRVLHELEAKDEHLESELALTKARIKLELDELRAKHSNDSQEIAKLKAATAPDLLSLFEAKLLRGLAVGRLQKTACTACNMNLTATALAELNHIPADGLASCPECQAILIR